MSMVCPVSIPVIHLRSNSCAGCKTKNLGIYTSSLKTDCKNKTHKLRPINPKEGVYSRIGVDYGLTMEIIEICNFSYRSRNAGIKTVKQIKVSGR